MGSSASAALVTAQCLFALILLVDASNDPSRSPNGDGDGSNRRRRSSYGGMGPPGPPGLNQLPRRVASFGQNSNNRSNPNALRSSTQSSDGGQSGPSGTIEQSQVSPVRPSRTSSSRANPGVISSQSGQPSGRPTSRHGSRASNSTSARPSGQPGSSMRPPSPSTGRRSQSKTRPSQPKLVESIAASKSSGKAAKHQESLTRLPGPPESSALTGLSNLPKSFGNLQLSGPPESWLADNSWLNTEPFNRLPLNLLAELSSSILEHNGESISESYLIATFRVPKKGRAFENYNKNIRKNRHTTLAGYSDMYCVDSSRVILKPNKFFTSFTSDYIHANRLHLADDRQMILTQAPLSKNERCYDDTVPDFWHMVCQERVMAIIMVCMPSEYPCRPAYFPMAENNVDTLQFGPYIIRRIGESQQHGDIAIVTTLQLTCGTDDVRHIQHIRAVTWDDFGTPTQISAVLYFIWLAWQHKRVVVHCAVGVGRTGVVALASLVLDELLAGRVPDIGERLLHLRGVRMYSVQGVKQYIFVNKSMLWLAKQKGQVDGQKLTDFDKRTKDAKMDYELVGKLLEEADEREKMEEEQDNANKTY